MKKIKNKLCIILIDTQLPENLGATSRAILNFGFDELRVVNPNFSLNHEKILPLSAGANLVVKKIKKYDSLESSISDLNYVLGCTARKRSINKICLGLNDSAKKIKKKLKLNNKIGIIFGPENSGLTNEHISLVDEILMIETNPNFSSLNLSHAVMIVCYEFSKIFKNISIEKKIKGNELLKKKELISFFDKLEILLEKSGFIKTQERRLIIISKIRNIFNRLCLTKSELNTLLGIISSLTRRK